MLRFSFYLFFSFMIFSGGNVFALSINPSSDLPLDLRADEIVKLCGRVPARHYVEEDIIKNKIDLNLVCSLYDKTIANEALYNQHKSVLVGESGNLSIEISKKTKEMIRIFIGD